MFYDDDLGTENIFFLVCLISEYASVTINVYLYSIHLGIWNVTAVFQFPFKALLAMLSALRLVAGIKHAPRAFGRATWQAGASSDRGIHKTNQYARKVN